MTARVCWNPGNEEADVSMTTAGRRGPALLTERHASVGSVRGAQGVRARPRSAGSAVRAGLAVWLVFAMAAAVPAREAFVENVAQLAAVLPRAGAGDTIVLRKGEWPNTPLIVGRGGSKASPLVIRAEIPGETVLSGLSFVTIAAPFVIVDGLAFQRGAIAEGAVVVFNSHHGVLRNAAVIDYNPPAADTQYYWVFFNGDHNAVDRCYFKGKSNLGPVIGNARDGSRHNAVTNCHFKNIPYRAANGREIIRVWGYGQNDEVGQDGAFFTIEGNLFDHADGEGSETISLKSNRNMVRRNTLLATRGGITIRRGSFNTVTENLILGQGVDRAHGLRIAGQHNVVADNYVAGCDFGIAISAGEYVRGPLTPKYKPHAAEEGSGKTRTAFYPPVVHLTLTGNVLVDNSEEDLDVGRGYLDDWPAAQMVLLPEECVIERNRFVRPRKGTSVIGMLPKDEQPFSRFPPKPNRYAGNVVLGGKVKYAPAEEGFDVQPLPEGWSVESEVMPAKPLTDADVGPEWVIALRQSGSFTLEDAGVDQSAMPGAATETKDEKKARKAREKAAGKRP